MFLPTKKKTVSPTQAELFIAELINNSIKDDIHSMEYPIYSLSKNKDIAMREYINERTNKTLRIIPSGFGAATIFDKDILIFAMSQIINALNKKPQLPVSRNIRFATIDYMNATGKNGGGEEFTRIVHALRRLCGTTLETNIKTGEIAQTKGFGLIEDYKVTQKTKNGKGALEIEITLSKWIYNALLQFEVLTIPHSYFQITQALEKRIYELSRKHIGQEGLTGYAILRPREKVGAKSNKYAFKQDLKNILAPISPVGRNGGINGATRLDDPQRGGDVPSPLSCASRPVDLPGLQPPALRAAPPI